jgi:hypothetical protein
MSRKRRQIPRPPRALPKVVLEAEGVVVLEVEDAVEHPPRGLRRDMTTIRT